MTEDAVTQFAKALADAGLRLSGPPIMDGKLRRVPVEGDAKGKTSGSYKGHLDAAPCGYIKNWKTAFERRWRAAPDHAVSSAERQAALEHARERAQADELEREALRVKAATYAAELMDAARPVTSHPYLTAKRVRAYGLGLSGQGNLLMPLKTVDGTLCNVQKITETGIKTFLRGGQVFGAFHTLGALLSGAVTIICEGYATAATIHEATGQPVVVVCSHGNLLVVARALRLAYPERHFIVAGDNDHQLPLRKDAGGNPLPNIGKVKAEEAAEAIGADLALPSFDAGDTGTDWNDYASMPGRSLQDVRDSILFGLAA
jgi:putative DNA primase/helicase